MHTLTAWFIRNPVAANLLMALILFMGILTALTIRIEGFPRVPPEGIVIATEYSGAPAAQVDELVTKKIEQALEGLEGVRSTSSQSSNGFSSVYVRRAGGQDLQQLLDKVRLRIDGVTDLPDKARRPVIQTDGFDFPALYINISGETDAATLQSLATRLKENLLAEAELSKLRIWGIIPRELRIEVEPEVLRKFNLTVADVTAAIQANSLEAQAGQLKTSGGNIFLRSDDRSLYAAEFGSIPIVERSSGSPIVLEDIAEVKDTFAEGDFHFTFNDKPTIGMEVQVGQKENLLRISKVVHEVVENYRRQIPEGVEIDIWGDSSGYISDRLKLLQSNGVQGLLLVILMLSLFLNVRLAFWVAMGIPISVMGALAVSGTKWIDYSLNDVTTFGLIIALGILVDDAVVVGESVYEERQKIKDPLLSTEAGVNRVSVATVFGILTTVAAFFPMLLLDNPLGKVLAGFSGIVILSLLFSLVESKFILPAHLVHVSFDAKPKFFVTRIWARVQGVAKWGLASFREKLYAPVLRVSIAHRYAVLLLFLAAGTYGIGLIGLGKIKTVFFPEVPGQIINVDLQMDARAPFDLTFNNIEKIRQIGDELNQELLESSGLSEPPIRAMFVIVDGPGSGNVIAEMIPVADRPGVEIMDLLMEWRTRTGQVEGATRLQFTGSEELGGGFTIQLLSKDADLLKLASEELREFLGNIDGVSSIRDGLRGGQPELRLTLRPEARNLGFTADTLANQIGLAYGGAEVQKIRRGSSEVKVIVQNSSAARDTISDLLSADIRSDTGAWVPLTTVANIEGKYVSGSVFRLNGKQVNSVAATIDKSTVAPEEVGQAVTSQFLPDMAARYPSVELKVGGSLEEIGEIRGGLLKALLLATVMIYVLMAVPLKSYWQPFVIISIVPFGFVGAAIGHLIMGAALSILSFFGMLALTGVVVNDSLVMMTRYNQARESGMPVSDALQDAGIGRFQAIFLTTATTVIGLLPLLTETSEQAQYLIPAAISLAYGEIFATTLMLILIPVLIAIVEDCKSMFQRVFLVA